MIDPQKSQLVLSALGQDTLTRLGTSVRLTRADLAEYRHTLPRLAARHTNRGILNWIHDQFFANVVASFEGAPRVQVKDHEPTRELFLGSLFRFRFKAHHADDLISSYPTAGFGAFTQQQHQQLVQEIRLVAGYRWDGEAQQLGEAVITARHGRGNVLWAVTLDEGGESGLVKYTPRPISDGPELPTIDLVGIERRDEVEGQS